MTYTLKDRGVARFGSPEAMQIKQARGYLTDFRKLKRGAIRMGCAKYARHYTVQWIKWHRHLRKVEAKVAA